MRKTILGTLLGLLCVATAGLAADGASPAAAPGVKPGALLAVPPADEACRQAAAGQPFCSGPGQSPARICSYLPPDSEPQRGYTAFSCSGQVQFDNYSWQTLVALNWPADKSGKPCTTPGPQCPYTSITTAPTSAARVWDYFLPANQVIPTPSEHRVGHFPGAPACGARAVAPGAPPVRVLTMTA
jgi:hypothetical protein